MIINNHELQHDNGSIQQFLQDFNKSKSYVLPRNSHVSQVSSTRVKQFVKNVNAQTWYRQNSLTNILKAILIKILIGQTNYVD